MRKGKRRLPLWALAVAAVAVTAAPLALGAASAQADRSANSGTCVGDYSESHYGERSHRNGWAAVRIDCYGTYVYPDGSVCRGHRWYYEETDAGGKPVSEAHCAPR